MYSLIIPIALASCSGPHCVVPPCVGPKCINTEGHRVSRMSPVLGSAVSEPLRSCTDGFLYDYDKDCCFRDIVVEPMLSCSKTGGTLEGDRCRCHRTKVVSCAAGYRYDPVKDSCETVNIVPMIPSCNHLPNARLSDDGKNCISYKPVKARLRCPKGSKLINNVCVSHVLAPGALRFYCPDGWLSIGNDVCEMQEEVTCSHEEIKHCKSAKCGFQSFKPCKHPCKILKKNKRNLSLCDDRYGPCDPPIDAEVVCQAADCMMQYGATYIQDRSVSVKTTCTRTTHMTARKECAQGELNRRGECCVPEYSEPIKDCPRNTVLQDGECMQEICVLSDYLCPAGYVSDCGKRLLKKGDPSRCECVARESIPAVRSCPVGTYATGDGMCEMYSPADVYCPDASFELNANGMCVGREHEPVRLEYTVTYVREKQCLADVCEEKAIKTGIQHKAIYKRKGRNITDCDLNPCVDVTGKIIRRSMEELEALQSEDEEGED